MFSVLRCPGINRGYRNLPIALDSQRFHHPLCFSGAAEKQHIVSVFVRDAASTFLSRHSTRGQRPRASPSATSSTSGSFITLTLAVPSCFAPVVVILTGSSLCAGASRFLSYEPDISGHMGNYALTSFSLSFLRRSHLLCPKNTLGIDDTVRPLLYQWTTGGAEFFIFHSMFILPH